MTKIILIIIGLQKELVAFKYIKLPRGTWRRQFDRQLQDPSPSVIHQEFQWENYRFGDCPAPPLFPLANERNVGMITSMYSN